MSALPPKADLMGYNARNDEICDNVTRMRREWTANSTAEKTQQIENAVR
jgi:hypothetical protein